ncbi:hypothetical protein LWC34_13410 [Kibdelosporangium philippinense]|uniref:PH domain-containing protein n=1 Tax=Kibdelosporangium philippinense TaxID=211113 RepID=A0ABS8Z7F9_9PSEU|nr:hypothetical protein [Kibdelosporangium philippinense]MCE7003818.1 hypothetical protein [Kibdelosporangium philippinense]
MSLGAGVLHSGEKVLWTGKPARQAPIDWIDGAACLFLLYCLGFAIVFLGTAAASFSLIACLPVALFLVRKRSIAVTYVLTNQRVLTRSSKGVEEVALSLLAAPVVNQQRASGVGTVSFGPPSAVAQAVLWRFGGPVRRTGGCSWFRSRTPGTSLPTSKPRDAVESFPFVRSWTQARQSIALALAAIESFH